MTRLASPQNPGRHRSHLGPPTPGLQSHSLLSGSQVSRTEPNLLQLQREGQPPSFSPRAAVFLSGQQPYIEASQLKADASNPLFEACTAEGRGVVEGLSSIISILILICILSITIYKTAIEIGKPFLQHFAKLGPLWQKLPGGQLFL